MDRYRGESSQLVQAIALGDRPQRLVWVSPRLSMLTGCTRRRLRRAKFLWSLRTLGRPALRWAGELPVWFRDPVEYAAVSALIRAGP
jgi:hypothetical protein